MVCKGCYAGWCFLLLYVTRGIGFQVRQKSLVICCTYVQYSSYIVLGSVECCDVNVAVSAGFSHSFFLQVTVFIFFITGLCCDIIM